MVASSKVHSAEELKQKFPLLILSTSRLQPGADQGAILSLPGFEVALSLSEKS
ncbi:UNVERIFIED_CONTAM: hypothetical protein FKN15_004529 [Acipenser sinensis]